MLRALLAAGFPLCAAALMNAALRQQASVAMEVTALQDGAAPERQALFGKALDSLLGGRLAASAAAEQGARQLLPPQHPEDPEPVGALSELLAKPMLTEDLLVKGRLQQAAPKREADYPQWGAADEGRFVRAVNSEAADGDDDFGLRKLLEGLRKAFDFRFPLAEVEAQQSKALDLVVRVSVGVVLCAAILGAWLGFFVEVPLLAAGFWLLFLGGVLFFLLSFFMNDGWMFVSSLSLSVLAATSALVVGNDPLLMHAFCAEVGELRLCNKELQRSNNALQARLGELSRVQDELLRVSRHFEGNILAAQDFLKEMQKMVALQIVTDILNLYFTTPQADIFASSLVIVPDLVPGFDMEKLVESVQLQGLTMAELATLLDAIVADDPVACTKALEALCRRGKTDDTTRVRDQALAPAMASMLAEQHEHVAVVPIFSCCGFHVYSRMHMAAIVAVVLALVLLTISLVRHSMAGSVCALLELALASGLALHAELLAIVQALREQLAILRHENARFERVNKELAEEAAFLGRLGRGFDKLQAEFGGSVERARAVLDRKNVAVKTSTIAVVTHLFVQADRDKNGRLDEEELETFVKSLELVFHALPDFDPDLVRRKIHRDGFRQEQLVPLMDLILGVEQATSASAVFLG